METKCIIVIEVDNKRAAAAYRKGWEDLDRVMPQLLAATQAQDAEVIKQYQQAFAAWGVRKPKAPTVRRSFGRQEVVEPNYFEQFGHLRQRPQRPRLRKGALESVREELKHLLNIAEATTAPYQMTEHQVRKMVAWEDGSEVEYLQRYYDPR